MFLKNVSGILSCACAASPWYILNPFQIVTILSCLYCFITSVVQDPAPLIYCYSSLRATASTIFHLSTETQGDNGTLKLGNMCKDSLACYLMRRKR